MGFAEHPSSSKSAGQLGTSPGPARLVWNPLVFIFGEKKNFCEISLRAKKPQKIPSPLSRSLACWQPSSATTNKPRPPTHPQHISGSFEPIFNVQASCNRSQCPFQFHFNHFFEGKKESTHSNFNRFNKRQKTTWWRNHRHFRGRQYVASSSVQILGSTTCFWRRGVNQHISLETTLVALSADVWTFACWWWLLNSVSSARKWFEVFGVWTTICAIFVASNMVQAKLQSIISVFL